MNHPKTDDEIAKLVHEGDLEQWGRRDAATEGASGTTMVFSDEELALLQRALSDAIGWVGERVREGHEDIPRFKAMKEKLSAAPTTEDDEYP